MESSHVFFGIIAVAGVVLMFGIREVVEAAHVVAGATGRWALGGGAIIVLFMAFDISHDALMLAVLAPTARTWAECQAIERQFVRDANAAGFTDNPRVTADVDAYNSCVERLSRSEKIMDAVIAK